MTKKIVPEPQNIEPQNNQCRSFFSNSKLDIGHSAVLRFRQVHFPFFILPFGSFLQPDFE